MIEDELFDQAVEIVLRTGQASASNLQRKMKIGYARAGRIIDMMERRGMVGPADGSKPRKILVGLRED
jgi:S-DNA-T family DNA segregation ATPase FtsK/SpoIIIE